MILASGVLLAFFLKDGNDDGSKDLGSVKAYDIERSTFASGFTSPLSIHFPEEGSDRSFVADQIGMIRIIDGDGNVKEDPFLDLRDKIVDLSSSYDERGLLGLAFHPYYEQNGRFFVYYSAPLREGAPEEWDHTSIISEFKVSPTDPDSSDASSERIILLVDQPQKNHNSGCLLFGPDGYLYISLGDGGGSGDKGIGHPQIGNGQDTTTILGSILRIDVNTGDPYGIPSDNPFVSSEGRDEIYAYGFRNPYGLSFDDSGRFFVADVGQDDWEEIDIVDKGKNYGWNLREGLHPYPPGDDSPAQTGHQGESLIDPILEISTGESEGGIEAIVGGYLYSGNELADLKGSYVFGSWSGPEDGSGSLYVAKEEAGGWSHSRIDLSLGSYLLGIGEDPEGELYLLTSENAGPSGETGKISKLVRIPA